MMLVISSFDMGTKRLRRVLRHRCDRESSGELNASNQSLKLGGEADEAALINVKRALDGM